ncbi:hypothetical protein FNW02_37630 [Komarekiella sp. 'clone 1']|uniref:DNA-damage-inducible protein D n=1 Tax=Komarekiella delphini-convector SJRDD-AB1 TaxID=2593771 RepID=A0AA40VVX3_9NOST|nr:hypothetical protein [Komarekiella delphini-convector]MBD6621260.1 hypothetical protein [Komarekiella delphini-convector SJRDD-AB1]
MSQIEIAKIIEQISQEIQIDVNGQGKASVRATARLADVNDAGLLRNLRTAADKTHSKLVEKLIRKGFEPAEIWGWSESGIPDIAVATIIHYYGYEAGKRCTLQATLVCEAFESIGVRAWIQDKLGWTKPAAHSETAMTQIQLLAAIAQQMALQEQRLLEQQQQQTEILARIQAVEVEQERFNAPCGHKYSIVGFANLQGLEISRKEASTKGKKASALCRQQGIEIERIRDPRFGRVGLYPESVLIEVFKAEQN